MFYESARRSREGSFERDETLLYISNIADLIHGLLTISITDIAIPRIIFNKS